MSMMAEDMYIIPLLRRNLRVQGIATYDRGSPASFGAGVERRRVHRIVSLQLAVSLVRTPGPAQGRGLPMRTRATFRGRPGPFGPGSARISRGPGSAGPKGLALQRARLGRGRRSGRRARRDVGDHAARPGAHATGGA